jgi:hypothetical protein
LGLSFLILHWHMHCHIAVFGSETVALEYLIILLFERANLSLDMFLWLWYVLAWKHSGRELPLGVRSGIGGEHWREHQRERKKLVSAGCRRLGRAVLSNCLEKCTWPATSMCRPRQPKHFFTRCYFICYFDRCLQ